MLRLPLRPDPTRETLATDGHEIRYSPRWVAETEAHLIETAMARVVMACALKHHTRRGERDPERWQMASQLVTHALIRDAGFTLPPDAEAWDDLSVEQAYDRLPDARGRRYRRRRQRTVRRRRCRHIGRSILAGRRGRRHRRPVRFRRRRGPPGPGRRRWRWRPGRRGPRRPEPGRQRPGRGWRVRCAAEPRSVRHRRGHGCRRAGGRRRR